MQGKHEAARVARTIGCQSPQAKLDGLQPRPMIGSHRAWYSVVGHQPDVHLFSSGPPVC
jgi:hypothetical protein